MNIIKKNILSLLVLLPLACSNAQQNNEREIEFNSDLNQMKNSLRAHIEFLADDLLRGRDVGSVEYDIAAQYVISQFKQFGLTPAGENNSWLQSVPLVKSTIDKNAVEMIISRGTQRINFEYDKPCCLDAALILDIHIFRYVAFLSLR